MDEKRFRDMEQKAREAVEEAHARLRANPLQGTFPGGIRKCVLLGTKFQVSHLDFVNDIVTFTVVE